MNIHKNDQVKVITGNARGKTGKVLKVFRENGRVIVEGVNIIKRHTKPNAKNPQGGVVQKEAPINVSNVMVLCPKCGKQTRIGHK
jgi:large subunit ribosomal protein L24